MAIKDLIPWNNRSGEVSTRRGNDVHPLFALHREMNRMFDGPIPDLRILCIATNLSWFGAGLDCTRNRGTPNCRASYRTAERIER